MSNPKFVPSALHVVASGVDISKDLASTQEKTISSLLEDAYEEKESENTTKEKNQ